VAPWAEVVGRYGRIDGIIHGAGVLRDAFLDQMTPEDFSLVADVKFLGAWNLFSAAEGAGLKFFVAFPRWRPSREIPARPTTLPPTA